MMNLKLEWQILDSGHVALVFDKDTWLIFQNLADSRGLEATDMIAKGVAQVLGLVMAEKLDG